MITSLRRLFYFLSSATSAYSYTT